MNKIKPCSKTKAIKPKILYYGMPVILLNTLNEDGTVNMSPMSSSWALGDAIVLGIGPGSKALDNIRRHPECVINVPCSQLWENVEKLAPFTGRDPIPDYKRQLGFSYCKDKYEVSGLTPVASMTVQPSRIAECPLQIEARVRHIRISDNELSFAIVETQVVQVHAHEAIISGEHHINPQLWNPLIYNFRHYFGLGPELGKTFRAET